MCPLNRTVPPWSIFCCCLVVQWWYWLFHDPMDPRGLPGSLLHSIPRARVLECHSRGSSLPTGWHFLPGSVIRLTSPPLAGGPNLLSLPDKPHFGPCLDFKIRNLWQCPKWDISNTSYGSLYLEKLFVSMDICIIPRGTLVLYRLSPTFHLLYCYLLLQFPAWLSIALSGQCSSALFQSLPPPSRPKFYFYSVTCCFVTITHQFLS